MIRFLISQDEPHHRQQKHHLPLLFLDSLNLTIMSRHSFHTQRKIEESNPTYGKFRDKLHNIIPSPSLGLVILRRST